MCFSLERQNKSYKFSKLKKTDTKCKRKRGHSGSEESPTPPREVTATLLKQHHQSPISCHGPKLRSEQIHVSGKGQILAEPALAQLDISPLTLCQERAALMTESRRSSFLTCSPAQRPLLTRVGPPPSITHSECLPYETDLSKKLSGEFTRGASSGQLDVAPVSQLTRFPSHAAPETPLLSEQSHINAVSLGTQEPFPIFRLPPKNPPIVQVLHATGVFLPWRQKQRGGFFFLTKLERYISPFVCVSQWDTKESVLRKYPNRSAGQKSQNDIWLNGVDGHVWTKHGFQI